MRVIYDYQITLVTTLVISYFRIEIIKMQYLRYYIYTLVPKKGYYIHWVQVNPTAEIFFSFLVFCIWSNGRGKKLTFSPLTEFNCIWCLEIILDLKPLFYINEAYILAHIIICNKAKFPSDFHLQYYRSRSSNNRYVC